MDLKKAQLLLDKINRLYKSMSLDPESVALIEKDLMRDYIKQLYGIFLEDIDMPSKTTPPPQKQIHRHRPTPPPVITSAIIDQPITTPPPPAPKRVIAPPVEQVIEVPPPVVPTYQPRVVTPPPPPPPRKVLNEDEEQLFALENGSELSHKLGSLPIADLTKAMGINERIFTINELFRGDSMAFKHTMSALNQLSTFSEAKTYLAKNIVNQFDWTNKQRRNNAKNFIKLIRRRYI